MRGGVAWKCRRRYAKSRVNMRRDFQSESEVACGMKK